MEKISKNNFCLLLAIRPHSVIGKEITLKDGRFVKIIDVSLGGNYMYIGEHHSTANWTGTDVLDDEFIINGAPLLDSSDIISAKKIGDISEKLSKSYRGGRRLA